jgi:hypothetical protein
MISAVAPPPASGAATGRRAGATTLFTVSASASEHMEVMCNTFEREKQVQSSRLQNMFERMRLHACQLADLARQLWRE